MTGVLKTCPCGAQFYAKGGHRDCGACRDAAHGPRDFDPHAKHFGFDPDGEQQRRWAEGWDYANARVIPPANRREG